MTPGKAKQLVQCYPELFQNIYEKMPFALFCFECEDGWFEILKECISKIKDICERDNLEIKVSQIKEKYGTLRFYLDSETMEIDDIIKEAEEKSEYTCEDCGSLGKLRVNNHKWYFVRCNECWEKMIHEHVH